MWRLRVVIALLAVLAAGGCGLSVGTATPTSAADGPSESATMICAEEAESDIAGAIGVTPQSVGPPTWQDHLYTCRYVYPNGSMTLSVKELASDADTENYLAELKRTLGDAGPLGSLGREAFSTPTGSVVVRKDAKVLLVDTTALPAAFGNPSMTPATAARVVGLVILGCWTGV